jgi:hypothetical protein
MLTAFTSSWTTNPLQYFRPGKGNEDTLHFRYVDLLETKKRHVITTGGIKIDRESGPLPTLDVTTKHFFVEKRSSFRLSVDSDAVFPFYAIIAIVHDKNHDVESFRAESIRYLFANYFSGPIILFFVVVASLNGLFDSWNRVLKALDEELKATVCISTTHKLPFLKLTK